MGTVIKAASLEDGTKEEMRAEEIYINREEEAWMCPTNAQDQKTAIDNSKAAATPKVNIDTDSAEIIKEKWSKVDTKTSFTRNSKSPPSTHEKPRKTDRKTLRIAVIAAGMLMVCFIGYAIAVPFGKHIGKRRKERQRNKHE